MCVANSCPHATCRRGAALFRHERRSPPRLARSNPCAQLGSDLRIGGGRGKAPVAHPPPPPAKQRHPVLYVYVCSQMFRCLCIHRFMHLYVCAVSHLYMNTCIQLCMSTFYMCTQLYVHMQPKGYMLTCVHANKHIHAHVYIFIHPDGHICKLIVISHVYMYMIMLIISPPE